MRQIKNTYTFQYAKFTFECIMCLSTEQMRKLLGGVQEVCREWSGRRRARREVSTSKEDWRPAACWPCSHTELYTSRKDRTLGARCWLFIITIRIFDTTMSLKVCSAYYLNNLWFVLASFSASSNHISAAGSYSCEKLVM